MSTIGRFFARLARRLVTLALATVAATALVIVLDAILLRDESRDEADAP